MTTRALDLGRIRIAGERVSASIAQAMTSVTLEYSVDAVSQLTLVAEDTKGTLLRSGLAAEGSIVTFDGDPWLVGATGSTWGQDNTRGHQLTCRSRVGRSLRRTYKASVERKVSPTDWVRRRVAAAGGTAVCQASSKQGTIAQTSGKDRQSELDVIASLAGDLEWSWVEYAGRLYFGSRYWAWGGGLAGQKDWKVTWSKNAGTDALAAELDVDSDDDTDRASGTVTLSYERGIQLRPWHRVQLAGYGSQFDGLWLVGNLTIAADMVSPITVEIARPRPPAKKSGSTK